MADLKLKKYAELLVNYSLEIKKDDQVLIQGEDISKELIKEIYKEVLKNGAHPLVITKFDEQEELFYKYASEAQLNYQAPFTKYLMENVDASIKILGHNNTKNLAGVDPEKIKKRSIAQKEISEILMNRAAAGSLNWNICQFPTHADAQEAGMSLSDYKEFVYQACHLNKEDPVAYWEEFGQELERIASILNEKEELHFISEDTDLKVKVGGRTWIADKGKENYPGGEVFTGPIEDSVEGKIRFSFPGIYSGKEIEDIRLEFKNGKVVKASAAKGEELLHSLLDTDEGSRYVGEVAVGCNKGITEFTRNMLFDEKIGGTIHLALGRSYPETGGKNISTIHWDMLCDMKNGGEIYADDQLIYRDGKFII
ncbi:MAG: aminopeptidase [Bacillota bacterium]